jgi:hypothetical protein
MEKQKEGLTLLKIGERSFWIHILRRLPTSIHRRLARIWGDNDILDNNIPVIEVFGKKLSHKNNVRKE